MARQFRVGQRVWLFDDSLRRLRKVVKGRTPEEQWSLTYTNAAYYVPFKVVGVDDRCYVLLNEETGQDARYDHVRADQLFISTADKEERVVALIRTILIADIEYADDAEIRRIAKALGYWITLSRTKEK